VTTVLRVHNVSAWYGQAKAIDRVTLEVEGGTIVGLIGHNGAGKSTLLRTIAGAHKAADGEVSFRGEQILGRRPNSIAALGVHLVREGAPVFPGLTIDEHLMLGKRLSEARGEERIADSQVWSSFPELVPLRGLKASGLSGGERQLLCLAVAVVSRPLLLLLDEPTVGLAPTAVRRVLSAIKELRREGFSLLIAEQRIDLLMQITRHNYQLTVGRIAKAITGDPEVAVADRG
jgi:branched-chain amino acid transport system ATP-binding protein